MKSHGYADLFPMMSDTEFSELCADIKANGLKEPIVTHFNQILDGRNRWKACAKMGVKPFFEEFKGTDAKAYVISKNLHRRHLDESQRAMLAAKLRGDNRANLHDLEKPLTFPEAAKTLNVSERSVKDAAKVRSQGSPELVAEVEAGKVTVSAAVKRIKEPKIVTDAERAESSYNVVMKSLPKLTTERLIDVGVAIANMLE